MKTILFIHQSAELYGSDKTLLQLVTGLNKEKFLPIVVLPNSGPLKELLEKNKIKVIEAPVLKLYRGIFTPKNIVKAFKDTFEGYKIIKKLKKEYSVEIIYSNTLAVLIGFLFCFFSKTKHIWHVHEILESPKFIAKTFRFLLNRKTNSEIIFNSKATQKFWNIKTSNTVVWNGIEPYSQEKNTTFREKFGFQPEAVIIALIGRISRWKGQQLLLEAFHKLEKTHTQAQLLFVGSPPEGQEHFLHELKQKIENFDLKTKVTIIPFQENIETIWQTIDIAVVPSTEPEPFGMVAIEAMMAAKPVVAANHGGLQEIIEDNKTGFFFTPNNVEDLQEKLAVLIENVEMRKTFGENGLKRATSVFSTKNYIQSIEKILIAI